MLLVVWRPRGDPPAIIISWYSSFRLGTRLFLFPITLLIGSTSCLAFKSLLVRSKEMVLSPMTETLPLTEGRCTPPEYSGTGLMSLKGVGFGIMVLISRKFTSTLILSLLEMAAFWSMECFLKSCWVVALAFPFEFAFVTCIVTKG